MHTHMLNIKSTYGGVKGEDFFKACLNRVTTNSSNLDTRKHSGLVDNALDRFGDSQLIVKKNYVEITILLQ